MSSGNRPVRTIPPYVRSVQETDYSPEYFSYLKNQFTSPNNPSSIPQLFRQPQPNKTSPSDANDYFATHAPITYPNGTYDHSKPREPTTFTPPYPPNQSRWLSFASPYTGGPPRRRLTQKEVDEAREILSVYDRQRDDDDNEHFGLEKMLQRQKRNQSLIEIINDVMLQAKIMPLLLRLLVLVNSITALSLAGVIFRNIETTCRRGSSTYMAVIVGVLSIVYTLYITYDEWTAEPIGMRPASEKLRLTLLDLFFIIFAGANLALAFEALTDPTWACKPADNVNICPYNGFVCSRQKGLVAVLLIGLFSWLAAFVVSLYRLVGRVIKGGVKF